MKTYEDLLAVGDSDKARAEFVEAAVREFEGSEGYVNALIADRYYHKHNVTIENYVKWLYTITGRKIKDIYSANYKLKTGMFRTGVIQHANYLMGNGCVFESKGVKERLGKTYDHEFIKAVKMAMVEGRSFVYWNNDHVEAFGYCCTDTHAGFRPLYSDETGDMMAGIRFRYKTVGKKKIIFYTLFEPEGVTEFKKSGSDPAEVMGGRKSYRKRTVSTPAEGVIWSEDLDYGGVLPIVPLYASDTYESDLVGLREKIDCFDLIESGLCDNVSDAAEIYWVFKNAGGLTDPNLAKLMERIRTTHAIAIDSEDGGGAESHTMDTPYEAREAVLNRLRTEIYEDWMLLDRRSLSAAQKTEQELQMAYQPMDDYTDELEYYVMETNDAILSLAGIDSDYHYIRNKSANMTEQTAMVLSAANYISPECVIRHLPFLSPEEQEDEIKNLAAENMQRFREDDEEEEDNEELN